MLFFSFIVQRGVWWKIQGQVDHVGIRAMGAGKPFDLVKGALALLRWRVFPPFFVIITQCPTHTMDRWPAVCL